jgi:hypothetical protein
LNDICNNLGITSNNWKSGSMKFIEVPISKVDEFTSSVKKSLRNAK